MSDLIPDEAWQMFPEDPQEKFIQIVKIAQTNAELEIQQATTVERTEYIRSELITIIGSAAEALQIAGVPILKNGIGDESIYLDFKIGLVGIITKLRIERQAADNIFTVQLGRITKAKLQQQIDQLRKSIAESDLTADKKSALQDRLEELEAELAKQRLSFARTMAIAASIMTVFGAGATTLANLSEAKEAILNIIQLVGEDKEKEVHERLRLTAPPKALADHSKSKSKTAKSQINAS